MRREGGRVKKGEMASVEEEEGGDEDWLQACTVSRKVRYHQLYVYVVYTPLNKFEWNMDQNG